MPNTFASEGAIDSAPVQFRVLAMRTTTGISPEIIETARVDAIFDHGSFYIGNPRVWKFVPIGKSTSNTSRSCEPTDLLHLVWDPALPCYLVVHDRPTDLPLLSSRLSRHIPWIDTARVVRCFWPELAAKTLPALIHAFGHAGRLDAIYGDAGLTKSQWHVVQVAAVLGAALARAADSGEAVPEILRVSS